MIYQSTRGQAPDLSFCDAVETGLASDGGLYLPKELPDLSGTLAAWEKLNYQELCLEFFKIFATDIDQAALKRMIADAYSGFDAGEIAPLKQLSNSLYVLELFHGPTLAFKDFALQLLGNLYEEQIKRTGRTINVLGATSGDTGSAAIHGLLGKEGVNIFILYPNGRISPLQERQMACTEASNVYPIAIDGTFDDAQTIVKELFGNAQLKNQLQLSAINSINLARILAQCVYYIWAWLRLPADQRTQAEFIVPTGNFGNVLAGWLATRMGLEVGGFRVATNQNDILHKLFSEGVYEIGDVSPSLAPSMDIQVASNFERFLYYQVGGDCAKVRLMMTELKEKGGITFDSFDNEIFSSSRTDDTEIPSIIQRVYKEFGYIADPHTACAFKDVAGNAEHPQVVLSTAHPAKFPETIEKAIGVHPTHDSLEKLKTKKLGRHELPATAEAIQSFLQDNT